MNIVVICPTYNAGDLFIDWIRRLKSQSVYNLLKVIIIDSSSTDNTQKYSSQAGFDVISIDKSEFNHAGTRNRAAQFAHEKYNSDLLIFLTQDALLEGNDSIAKIIEPFENVEVSAVCGRQLPHRNADPIAKHARIFNYKTESRISSKKDISKLGLKTAYMSNSFAAYRYEVYEDCEGFPLGLIFGEDMYLAAKMILKGHKTYYSGDAKVLHSHNYDLTEEFRRYFDIGVFHSSQPFLLENFGKPSGEGFRFAISEIKYSWKEGGIYWVFNSVIRTGLKFIGYKLGSFHKRLSLNICRKLSMDKNYWK